VVVYKIDRLTRSLFDFAKIVETFDAHHVSFVSVTQSFNTTTSMGRLTLNVLLSFAEARLPSLNKWLKGVPMVVVEHGHGFSTRYGHLSEIKATVGQVVRRGSTIGLMGQTGDATGPHVHYEIRVYGAAVDPTKYME